VAVSEEVWDFPPAGMKAPTNGVDIWRASLDSPSDRVEPLTCLLSVAEHVRASRFHFERDRRRFVTARGVLRIILGRYLSIPPDRLQFCYSVAGKPALSLAQTRHDIEFSVSRSSGLILYAVTCTGKVGIDIERIRVIANTGRMTDHILSRRESAVLRTLPLELRQAALFSGWTRKEAYLKACGDGLSRSLNQIDVSLPPFEPARPVRVQGDPWTSFRWSLQGLASAPGYAAALATEGANERPLRCLQWPEWL
jgi:4'-phosphopantetheinyl transferase